MGTLLRIFSYMENLQVHNGPLEVQIGAVVYTVLRLLGKLVDCFWDIYIYIYISLLIK